MQINQVSKSLIKSLPDDLILHVLSEYVHEAYLLLPNVSKFFDIIIYHKTHEKAAEIAASIGHLPLLEYILSKKRIWFNPWICQYAAQNGHLDCLKCAREHGCACSDMAATKAAQNGHLNCLIYLIQHKYDEYGATRESIRNGHLACLKAINALRPLKKMYNVEFCDLAAEYGQLECLKHLHSCNHVWSKQTCEKAAEYGHLDCIIYLHKNKCPWGRLACAKAALNGHLNCLMYLHEHGCKWNEETCTNAAKNGHLDCLKYAYEHGCLWNKWTKYLAAQNRHLDCLLYIDQQQAKTLILDVLACC